MLITNLSSFANQPVILGHSSNFFFEYGNMTSVYYYYGQGSDFRTYGTSNTVMATNTSYIASFTKTAATSGTLYVNGTAQTSFTNSGGGLVTTPSASASLILGGYTVAAGFAISGYIPLALFFKTDLSDAMRKRVDHFAARSWKFSCN
jgi:hypothetical protein